MHSLLQDESLPASYRQLSNGEAGIRWSGDGNEARTQED